MKKNHILNNLRLDEGTDKLLSEIAESLDLSKTALARLLLNRSLKQLKADIIKAGGIDKITFEIRPTEL